MEDIAGLQAYLDTRTCLELDQKRYSLKIVLKVRNITCLKTGRTMIAFRTPAIRHSLFRESAPCLRTSQRRWAQVHDIRLVRTDRKPDDVFEKYREKLARKAKEYVAVKIFFRCLH